MSVIGIDPGTKCGWCVRHDGGGMDSGTWNLKGGRFEGGGMRFLRMRQHIAELLDTTKPTLVAFEEVRRHQGVDAAHIYGGIIAVITEECERRKVPYMGIPVGTIKKRATGKGNAGKPDMMDAARREWPGWTGDDNEADARWIAVCASEAIKRPEGVAA